MTPSALTPAARGARSTAKGSPASATKPPASARPASLSASVAVPPPPVARSTGHRSGVGRGSAVRAPRRVSGPLSGMVSGGTVALPAPGRAPSRPAPPRPHAPRPTAPRPSAPRRSAARPARTRAAGTPHGSLFAGALAALRALPDHPLLDRIVRGRAWIPLLGVLLVGIVAMQVEVLKLNAGVGRALAQSEALQSRNEVLRIDVAQLDNPLRIETMASKMGMTMASPGAADLLSAGGVDVSRALNSIASPNPTNFATMVLDAQPSSATEVAAQSTTTGDTAASTDATAAAGTTAPAAGGDATSTAGAATPVTAAPATEAAPATTGASADTAAPADTAAAPAATVPATGTAAAGTTTPATSAATGNTGNAGSSAGTATSAGAAAISSTSPSGGG